MRLSEVLCEARKNPSDNPKISAYQQIKQYQNNPNAFIHFSKIRKLGIDPRNNQKNDTPLGIYAYPLLDTWTKYNVDAMKSFKKYPYGADFPYIFVFEYTNKLIDASTYNNWNRDLSKLTNTYDIDVASITKNMHSSNDFKLLYNVTKAIAKELNPSNFELEWNKVLRGLGYNAFITKHGEIHSGEPYQALFLQYKDINILDIVLNKDYPSDTDTYSIDTPKELGDILDKNEYQNIRALANSLTPSLMKYFQKYLEDKNQHGKLFDYIYGTTNYGRNPNDVKLLLLIWMNGEISNKIQRNTIIEIQYYFKKLSIKDIMNFANAMVKSIWDNEIIEKNITSILSK